MHNLGEKKKNAEIVWRVLLLKCRGLSLGFCQRSGPDSGPATHAGSFSGFSLCAVLRVRNVSPSAIRHSLRPCSQKWKKNKKWNEREKNSRLMFTDEQSMFAILHQKNAENSRAF